MTTMPQRAQLGRFGQQDVYSGPLPSSFIDHYHYKISTQSLTLTLNGRDYTYTDVSYRVFQRFLTGRAVCVTSDEARDPPRWVIGDRSHGAFYNQFIKIGGIRSRFVRSARARIAGAVRRFRS